MHLTNVLTETQIAAFQHHIKGDDWCEFLEMTDLARDQEELKNVVFHYASLYGIAIAIS